MLITWFSLYLQNVRVRMPVSIYVEATFAASGMTVTTALLYIYVLLFLHQDIPLIISQLTLTHREYFPGI